MNFGDFLHSKRWKLMQNYIYSWGASVVLIGALFKLEHLEYASVFLGVGLSIEAIIFFVSAFEPLLEMPDWKAVYPQLRTGQEDQRDIEHFKRADEKYKAFFGGGGGGSISLGDIPKEQMDSLRESFEKLSQTANGLKDISDSTVASKTFVNNLNNASQSIETIVIANNKVSEVMGESVQEIAKSYKSAAKQIQVTAETSASGINQSLNDLSGSVAKTAEDLKGATNKVSVGVDKTVTDLQKSVSVLTSSFDKTINDLSISSVKVSKDLENTSSEFGKQLNSSAKELTSSYQEMTNSLTNGFKGLEKSSQNYTVNLDKLNKNLTSINTTYELQLKNAVKAEQLVNDYSKGVGEIGKLLNLSVEETKKFNENTKAINQNIKALNDVYGTILGALNGGKK